jgi:hypothetical protein
LPNAAPELQARSLKLRSRELMLACRLEGFVMHLSGQNTFFDLNPLPAGGFTIWDTMKRIKMVTFSK